MSVRSLDTDSVNKICLGQVVVSLCGAVKEIVENSLDANATYIEIKFKENGVDLIEVVDNGKGIIESDFDGIAQKHHTSKLETFSDLSSVGTFGFRGEALSALAMLSTLTISTKHASNLDAYRLSFDHSGLLTSKEVTARECGTTVSVSCLFSTLPVRRKELKKHSTKEYAKCLAVLQGYALCCRSVKFVVMNSCGMKKKSIVFTTPGKQASFKDTYILLFGVKEANDLVPFELFDLDSEILESMNLSLQQYTEVKESFQITGFISHCAHGRGRPAQNRQFFYINQRPIDYSKLYKTVQSVYQVFNHSQYPAIYLEFTMESGTFDINVTPDKRTIYLKYEKIVLAIISHSLKTLFEGLVEEQNPNDSLNQSKLILEESKLDFSMTSGVNFPIITSSSNDNSNIVDNGKQAEIQLSKNSINSEKKASIEVPVSRVVSSESSSISSPLSDIKCNTFLSGRSINQATKILPEGVASQLLQTTPNLSQGKKRALQEINAEEVIDFKQPKLSQTLKEVQISFCYDRISRFYTDKCYILKPSEIEGRRFKSNSVGDEEAEGELKRSFTKTMFTQLEPIGQFNLGFIIGRHLDDIFIIDQHAADEKKNYETFRDELDIPTQSLLQPLELELSAANQEILKQHIEVFRRNGFGIQFNEDSECNLANRVSLISMPASRNWQFGPADVEEMIFLLSECSDPRIINTLRPSKVHQMLASRACRKSIMIGQSLTLRNMKQILTNMAYLEQPWNCPHGRPTMRHLANLLLL